MTYFLILSIMYSYQQCVTIFEENLKKVNFQKHPRHLYEPIGYIMNLKGKRLRPALTLMACNLFSDHIENAIEPALAIEIFHNFTLVHDDIMDNAPLRRNNPTVHEKWDSNTAILSGDAMMILAYDIVFRTKNHRILKIFNDTALEVCEGQQYDMDFETTDMVTTDNYLNMIRLKTAVLIAASLSIGAICGGAADHEVSSLYEAGIQVGLAFQLQDDYLDVYAVGDKFGKAQGNDIVTNKKTYLMVQAFEKAPEKTKKELLTVLSDKKMGKEEKIKQVMNVYEETDIKTQTENQIKQHLQKGLNCLDKQLIENERKHLLKTVIKGLVSREY